MEHGQQSQSSIIYYLQWPTRTMYRLYQWTIKWAQTGYAKIALFLVALTESSFFPIPPDVLLIAMTVADRFRWWLYATIATVGSVLGAVIGYYIGYALYGSVSNLFDRNPGEVQGLSNIYGDLGRTYALGVRFRIGNGRQVAAINHWGER
jgi:membrane protein YqaA with SNARE-associated domain